MKPTQIVQHPDSSFIKSHVQNFTSMKFRNYLSNKLLCILNLNLNMEPKNPTYLMQES